MHISKTLKTWPLKFKSAKSMHFTYILNIDIDIDIAIFCNYRTVSISYRNWKSDIEASLVCVACAWIACHAVQQTTEISSESRVPYQSADRHPSSSTSKCHLMDNNETTCRLCSHCHTHSNSIRRQRLSCTLWASTRANYSPICYKFLW